MGAVPTRLEGQVCQVKCETWINTTQSSISRLDQINFSLHFRNINIKEKVVLSKYGKTLHHFYTLSTGYQDLQVFTGIPQELRHKPVHSKLS